MRAAVRGCGGGADDARRSRGIRGDRRAWAGEAGVHRGVWGVTIRELIVVMGRRWYVVLATLLIAAAATVAFEGAGGMYSTRTVVRFVLADYATLLPDNGSQDEDIIGFATLVAAEINDGRPAGGYARADAPFYGAGVRQGVMVSLPNTGGQWQASYSQADIEIQIVGKTHAWVAERQQELTDTVQARARELQEGLGAASDTRITTSIAPLTTQIDYITPTRSSRFAAYAAMATAAMLVAGWLAVTVDRAAGHVPGIRRNTTPSGRTTMRTSRRADS